MSTHILNPNTGRVIKVGGAVWRRLVNQGILADSLQSHELFKADDKAEALVAKEMLPKTIQGCAKPTMDCEALKKE